MDYLRKDTAKQYRNIRKILRGNEPEVYHEPVNYWACTVVMYLVYAMLILLSLVVFQGCAQADQTYEGYTLNQYANAIHHAEGNDNYGILSVRCTTKEECRRICKNTVRNNYKRWQRSKQDITFLSYLQRRYCPVGASNDPTRLNRYWVNNVNYWLMKG